MFVPQKSRGYHLAKPGSFDNLIVKESDVPQPRGNEVLVKIRAVSLQSRDIAIILGFYPIGQPDMVPCSDMAGDIIAIGEDVKQWKIGDRVSSNFFTRHIYGDTDQQILQSALGGQAEGVLIEYRAFPAESLVAIPQHLNYVEASTLPCAGLTAYVALHGPIPVKPGDIVLVLGTGGVSIFALKIALASGATVIGTSSSPDKLKVLEKLGAKHTINYKESPSWEKEVLKLTNNRGVDHVIEVGGAGTIAKSSLAARIGGSIHAIGFLAQEDSEVGKDSITFPTFTRKVLHVNGIYAGSVAQFKDFNRFLSAFPEATRPYVDRVFSFEKSPEAFAYLASQKHIGKVVVEIT
ncbi:hypothetical protein CPB83DRAFT_853253 [Crepidotus variabilis]|uniref:Enoyl reductase (ER) domain-containing protein n=1 Tax=Crepidotus variabilis TaxID=179855 RepID=A0A9P6JQU9_9AGAR|nr:hypothetical protein CPB83DRAFT_853253 [Crepidotus variabilis]